MMMEHSQKIPKKDTQQKLLILGCQPKCMPLSSMGMTISTRSWELSSLWLQSKPLGNDMERELTCGPLE